ncbi:response regulator transcription factor [Paenibacillus radicis (ex Gao et al. 2016)]|uniref:DNA-binding response regulator n=1 Tax=Paenibacillus radicis (ex Gao et al. 2016) TaxID=1737354 RepID=A0A917HHB2_9BACL|nr:response regulator transcription factor [Paenibacillus radicis (ex Gao et al. 2016)]GGG78514.1 DNA-binding response regulator [Paenibacillus radicis (ex Gao et al. 2016)]
MRILLLEDEEAIRGFVRINLKRNDMDVIEADHGEAALALAANEGPFDIALLDVMLPTISGFEVCEQLRRLYPGMGIIMLTAKSQEEDKIYGLELGADDYVQKPFSPGELIARIKSLYRRMKPVESSTAVVPLEGATEEGQAKPTALLPGADTAAETAAAAVQADNELVRGRFRLTFADRKLWKHEDEIILTPTEWTLVKLLMERQGRNVSRDDILTEVWGRYYVGDLKVVDVNIRRIRQKIEDNPSEPVFIETVWGLGYRWNRSDRP